MQRNLIIVLTEMLDSWYVKKSLLSCELNVHYSKVKVKRDALYQGFVLEV